MKPVTHGSILAVFFSATRNEIHEGILWYETARNWANAVSLNYSIPAITVAGVVAALSPNNRWSRNLIDAEALIKVHTAGGDPRNIKVSTFNKNKAKAIAILNGNNPLDILGGLKVRSFFLCINGDTNAVCVDGHAYSIWVGERVPTSSTPKISPKLYETIAEDYRIAAKQISSVIGYPVSGSEVQAITWVAWRNRINEEVGK